MPRVEQTSKRIASIAGRILAGGDYTMTEVRDIAASVLNQAKPKLSIKLKPKVKKRAK